MDKLEIMLARQREFTEKFYKDKYGKDIGEMSPSELLTISRELTLQLIVECTEVLQEIKGWKSHRANNDSIDIAKFREELVDVLKFHFNFLILFDIDANAIFKDFMRKSEIVEKRYEQEKSKIKHV